MKSVFAKVCNTYYITHANKFAKITMLSSFIYRIFYINNNNNKDNIITLKPFVIVIFK